MKTKEGLVLFFKQVPGGVFLTYQHLLKDIGRKLDSCDLYRISRVLKDRIASTLSDSMFQSQMAATVPMTMPNAIARLTITPSSSFRRDRRRFLMGSF